MNANKIHVGGFYHDGKLGVREVMDVAGATTVRVTYHIVAAKIEKKHDYAEQAAVSLIGSTSTCDLRSFAEWAKMEIPAESREDLLNALAAKRLKLPPGEAAFMTSVAKEFSSEAEFPLVAGSTVSYAFNETRSARGVAKKGLVSVATDGVGAGGEVTLTPLGVAWLKAHNIGLVRA